MLQNKSKEEKEVILKNLKEIQKEIDTESKIFIESYKSTLNLYKNKRGENYV
jgi:hypothetical protein